MTNLQQKMAKMAYEFAAPTYLKKQYKGDLKIKMDEFRALVRNFPAMLQSNGLLAGWAFCLSNQNKGHYKAVLDALISFYGSPACRTKLNNITSNTEPANFFQNVLSAANNNLDGNTLMALTRESIEYSGWLKRAAEAICYDDSEQKAQGGQEVGNG